MAVVVVVVVTFVTRGRLREAVLDVSGEGDLDAAVATVEAGDAAGLMGPSFAKRVLNSAASEAEWVTSAWLTFQN